jgi:hypothetical protein
MNKKEEILRLLAILKYIEQESIIINTLNLINYNMHQPRNKWILEFETLA